MIIKLLKNVLRLLVLVISVPSNISSRYKDSDNRFSYVFLFQGFSPLGSPGSGSVKTQVLKNPVITLVAEKLGKSPAQVAIRWGLQTGHSLLPKSTTESRIKENFDVFDWSIPEDLFARFSEIEQACISSFSFFFFLCP